MKNLKKVLALGLALVMLLGMFTVASAATTKKTASDLTDWETVQHKDAVSLMVDLGIIIGTDQGTFDPTGNIDRASWAKMVYYAATGSDDADAYLGTASGLGDIAGNWAESYISYLKANKYISGDNYGNYNPSANVTVAEACKMMLTVLGYDATDRGYQNDAAWAGNIMRDAKRDGLMDNVDSDQTALTALTRENAAEIVLNALNANKVESIPQWDNGNKYITTYTKIATLGYDVFNMVKVTAVVDSIDTDGYAIITTVTDPAWPGVVGNINSKVKATSDLIGEEVSIYVKGDGFKWDSETTDISTVGTFKSVISSNVAKSAMAPVRTITSGITIWGDVTTRSTSNYVATQFAPDCVYYLNGEQITAKTLGEGETDPTPDSIKTAAGLRGTVVSFYTDEDSGDIDIVKVFKYTAAQLTGDAVTKTLSDGTVQVRVPGVVNSYVDSDKITGWQGLVEGDVVLYYRTSLGTTYSYTIEKAEKVSGAVTSYNSSGELTLNGSKYKASEQPNDGNGDVLITEANFKIWTNSYDLGDEFDFYLDKGGYLCYGFTSSEATDSSKVCLVIETEVTDNSLTSTGNLYANLLFADGSTEIVNVAKVNKRTVSNNVAKGAGDSNKVHPEDAQKELTGSGDAQVLQKFFNYSSTSAGYSLTEMNATNFSSTWGATENLGNGTAKVASIWREGSYAKDLKANSGDALVSGLKFTANNSTTFIVGKVNSTDDTVTYSVYKGINNVPEMDANMVTAIVEKDKTAARYVYLETGSFKDDVPDGYVFVVSADWAVDPELEDTYVVDIIDTDGTYTTMRVTEEIKNTINNDKNTVGDWDNNTYVGNFCEVGAIDEDGVVSELTVADKSANNANPRSYIVDMGDGVVALSGTANGVADKSYVYDSATQFVYVDMNWKDSTLANNAANVRETIDDMKLDGYGTFNPNNFFDGTDVSNVGTATATPEGGATETYMSVYAYVIHAANSNTADYVYVVRVLW